MLTLAASIQSWKNWLSKAASAFDSRVVPTRAKPVSSLPHPCSCHITTNSLLLSSIAFACAVRQNSCELLYTNSCTQCMHRRLWARALDPLGTHILPQINELSNSVILGNALQITTKWQSAETSKLIAKQNMDPVTALDSCLFAKIHVFLH